MTVTPELPATSREWHLLTRPAGWPKPEDFALVEAEIEQPGPGQVLVRNRYLSVDPYMRGRMSSAKSYVAPFELGKVMQGGAVGEVVASNADGISVGDHVLHFLGWREYAVVDAQQAVKVGPAAVPALKVDPEAVPLSTYLGVLGMTGLTAYAGLLRTASFQEGDSVFVSGAAGAVGSQVGQIAKLKGASRVIGSAGSDDKVKLLVEEYGFDAAFNYKNGSVSEQLGEAAPDGVDVYFDNVGGDHLEAAIGRLNRGGRIAVCGMISVYNNTEPAPGPKNLARLIQTRGRIEGFLVSDHYDLQPEFVREVGPWVGSGELKYRETVVEGIENNLEAFLGVLRGDNTGKMIVKL
ncbi:NADP-dependent oxidoreductase [Streptomyces montanus]|uniref:NADP-dependent oxidoreductase n=1 Tax=Streptomyces montanus TaxID=2580423 RepID=A0A5R9FX52_9ACTN|nr:NADP-dependent oxidoreductase [Streptomyces montanus]TLS46556.1 NADP-dependent oxidoreductase [Streptomyces montanus]